MEVPVHTHHYLVQEVLEVVAHHTHPMMVVEAAGHVHLLPHHYPEALRMSLRRMVPHWEGYIPQMMAGQTKDYIPQMMAVQTKDCIPQTMAGQKMVAVKGWT